jgi:elongation factor Ts
LKGIIKNLALQVAATNPLFLDRNSLDEEELNKKREVYKIEALSEGKPENITS